HNILSAHSGVGKNSQRVLPDLIVLRFKALGDAPVRPDADLTRRIKPTRIRRHLDAVAVLRRRWRDARRIASLEHSPPPLFTQLFVLQPLYSQARIRT